MDSAYGEVLVGEDIPCVLPLGQIRVLVKVRRDITAISQEYPWSALLRNRKRKAERTTAMRRELSAIREQRKYKQAIADLNHELAADIRQKDKGRIILLQR